MIELVCKCAMGKHYLTYGEKVEKYLNDLVKKHGQYRKITSLVTRKSYSVPVGFILVHGIKESELNMHGFEEWSEDKSIDTP